MPFQIAFQITGMASHMPTAKLTTVDPMVKTMFTSPFHTLEKNVVMPFQIAAQMAGRSFHSSVRNFHAICGIPIRTNRIPTSAQ